MQGMSFVNDSMSDHKSCGACPVYSEHFNLCWFHARMFKLRTSHAASMSTLPCKKAQEKTSASQCPVHGKLDCCSLLGVLNVIVFHEPSKHGKVWSVKLHWEKIFWRSPYICGYLLVGRLRCISIYICVYGRYSFSFQKQNKAFILRTILVPVSAVRLIKTLSTFMCQKNTWLVLYKWSQL